MEEEIDMISQFSGAILDQKRAYRFLIWRFWDGSPRVLFIGLNPSTANECSDDPTLRRCVSFARSWGYGGMYLCNVFSFITPDPSLLTKENAFHEANPPAINMARALSVLTVLVWGDGIEIAADGLRVAKRVAETSEAPMCFGLTKKGNPRHPLYLKGDVELVEYGGKR